MKKIVNTLLITLLLFSLVSCKKKLKDDIYIFFTSDVHCGITDNENMTFATMKALVDDTKAEHENVMLVDLGDYIQGGNIGTLSKGELVIKLMNAAGYDIVTFGNHEFDYSMEQLKKLIGMMEFDKIASNVNYTGKGTSAFEGVPEYIIRDFNGAKVGFLGVLTPNSIKSSTPKFFMEDGEYVYDFYDGEQGKKLAEKVQSLVDQMRKEGADYVVALTHLGSRDSDVPYDSIDLIHNTEGIDAVLDGHAHALIVEDRYPNKNGEDVILSSVGTKMETLGELIISKEGELSVVHIDAYDKQDEEMNNVIAETMASLDDILSEKVGESSCRLIIKDEEGIRMVRARETNAADFVTDALRDKYDAQITLLNAGSVRSEVEIGDVTFGNLLDIMPFNNMVRLYKATGQMILDTLEYGAKDVQAIYKFDGKAVGESGAFIQVSGLKYTIDTSIETPIILDDMKMFAGFSSDERRVKNVYVLIDGEYVPLDPEQEYTVSTLSYLAEDFGDGNKGLLGSELVLEDNYLDVNALRDYVVKLGTIPEIYENAQGRITIK